MKISYSWLQKFFDVTLPLPDEIVEKLETHAFEIEGTEVLSDDTVIDVNVTPNRGHDALSHRGIAKELSTILNIPLTEDPLRQSVALEPRTEALKIAVKEGKGCLRYSAALIEGVTVNRSPQWLQVALESIGQRPINNIVDATNFVMFNLGQPLHAFDAGKLGATPSIKVRKAREGEKLTTLDNRELALSIDDLLIVNSINDEPLGLAGIKGGKAAEIENNTTAIVIESAHFDSAGIRNTSKKFKLRTDASLRFEHGLSPELTAYALEAVVELILEIAGGKLTGYADVYPSKRAQDPVSVTLSDIQRILGTTLSQSDVEDIFKRFGFEFTQNGETFTVTPPFERFDIKIKEDLIEEVGRIWGFANIQPLVPAPAQDIFINKRYYYAERVAATLLTHGFSEVFTSSFRSHGQVELANAVALDKNFLRENLKDNFYTALALNRHNLPLLGLTSVKIFEVGTVFKQDREYFMLALGVAASRKVETEAMLADAQTALEGALGVVLTDDLYETSYDAQMGVLEIDFSKLLETLPEPTHYDPIPESLEVSYKPFSPYPFVLRDIALWASSANNADEVRSVIVKAAGATLVRADLFDTFSKAEKVSYAFHLVFQSKEKTLSDSEVNTAMEQVLDAVKKAGFEVR